MSYKNLKHIILPMGIGQQHNDHSNDHLVGCTDAEGTLLM